MKNKDEYKELPNLIDHMCFGCSQINSLGLQMRLYSDGETLVSWVNLPEHFCGYEKLVHGGIICTLLDEIMGRTCLYLLKKLATTKTITVDFLQPVAIGKDLTVEGRIVEMMGKHEALIEGKLYDDRGRICARSKSTYVAMHPDALERMGMADKNNLKALLKLCEDI